MKDDTYRSSALSRRCIRWLHQLDGRLVVALGHRQNTDEVLRSLDVIKRSNVLYSRADGKTISTYSGFLPVVGWWWR